MKSPVDRANQLTHQLETTPTNIDTQILTIHLRAAMLDAQDHIAAHLRDHGEDYAACVVEEIDF